MTQIIMELESNFDNITIHILEELKNLWLNKD